jgi:cyanate lyase
MFDIYELVLRSKKNKGLTYKDIDSKIKIGIVSVSHYCCRLKKMNFVELRHEGN